LVPLASFYDSQISDNLKDILIDFRYCHLSRKSILPSQFTKELVQLIALIETDYSQILVWLGSTMISCDHSSLVMQWLYSLEQLRQLSVTTTNELELIRAVSDERKNIVLENALKHMKIIDEMISS
jgi:hypothetical protein